MRPSVTCARRCGATADDAETALSLLWEHPCDGYWICPACDARDAEMLAELLASLTAPDAARERGR